MSKPVAIGIVFFAVVVAMVIYLSIGTNRVKVEVCMEFNGRQNCSTASSPTRSDAVRTATTGACALISGGVGDTIACEHRTPVSVRTID